MGCGGSSQPPASDNIVHTLNSNNSASVKNLSTTNTESKVKKPGGYDHLFKIMMVGDAGVGKSCLLNRYTNNIFNPEYSSTIGLDFSHRTIEGSGGKTVRLQIWDTAGQERFRTITSSYYRGSHGILLVFDVTEKRTFDHLEYWKEQIEEFSNPNVKVMIVGNKACTHPREVDTIRGKEKAEEWGYGYAETSAKTGQGVEEVFRVLVDTIIQIDASDAK